MKKLLGSILVGAVMAVSAAMAQALPILNTLVAGSDPLVDTRVIGFQLTDTDGVNDDVNAYLFLESAGYASSNTLGIYDWLDPSRTLTIFDGAVTAGTNATLAYAGGAFGIGPRTLSVADPIFGLFLTSPEGTFYSDPGLNADGVDHFAIFATEGSTGLAGVFEFVVGIEDLYGGGDLDYNDMVFGITDVAPYRAAVPAPAPLALMGLGLLALGASRKLRS